MKKRFIPAIIVLCLVPFIGAWKVGLDASAHCVGTTVMGEMTFVNSDNVPMTITSPVNRTVKPGESVHIEWVIGEYKAPQTRTPVVIKWTKNNSVETRYVTTPATKCDYYATTTTTHPTTTTTVLETTTTEVTTTTMEETSTTAPTTTTVSTGLVPPATEERPSPPESASPAVPVNSQPHYTG
jgi:hypothetical protein